MYVGAAWFGECLRVLNLQSLEPVASVQRTLVKMAINQPYFTLTNLTNDHTLAYQFWIWQYLNSSGAIAQLSPTAHYAASQYLANYFTLGGGASFDNNAELSPLTESTYLNFIAQYDWVTDANTTSLFPKLMNHLSDYGWYFEDRLTMHQLRALDEDSLEYNGAFYNPVASNYGVLLMLEAFNLFPEFCANISTNLGNFAAWPASQLDPAGFFYNNTATLTGNLRSTFEALDSQWILFEADPALNFGIYL